jgi:hypothetical protein
MSIHDLWTYDHAPQGTTDLSTGSGSPVYSETGLYNQYTGNPGYAYNNGITNAIQATTDGYLTINSNSTSNPGLAVQAKEVQDWSVATQYWVGFRTKTSKQNASNANVFTMSDTIGQANPSILVLESDMTAAGANVLNQDYYVEVFIDRTNRVYQVWINGVQVKSGTIAAASVVSGGNGFYWFGPWNSGLIASASRAFRDFYFLDVDATTLGRLGSIRSNLAALSAVSAPNYTLNAGSSGASDALSAFNYAYPTPPVATPNETNAVTDDVLTSTFNTSVPSTTSIVAVEYRHASQSTSAANLGVALTSGGTTQNKPAYAFADTNTMKYGRRAVLATTAVDGSAWTPAKVNATQLLLTPTN